MSGEHDLDRIHRLIDVERWPEVDDALAVALARDPQDVDLLLASARRHLGVDDAPRTLAAADAALGIAPHVALGHRYRALALSSLARHRDAQAAASRAVSLDPHDPVEHATLALVALRRRDRAVARRAAAEAVRLAPDDAEVHVVEGLTHLRAHRRRRAARSFHRALALAPENAKARELLAITHPWRVARLLNGLWSALALDPHEASAYENLVGALRRLMWVAWLVGLASLGSAYLLTDGRDPREATAGSITLGVVLLVVLGGLGAGLWRALDAGPRRGLSEVMRRDGAVLLILGLALMLTVGALAVCFAPAAGTDLVVAVSPLYRIGVLVSWVIWWRERRGG
ncbi:hypothetical protein [Nocardioides sp.]|uniref:hypothetical protein n=1 Tax=Nocardioides sp. TaxID=35761 RepID=UPI0035115D3E